MTDDSGRCSDVVIEFNINIKTEEFSSLSIWANKDNDEIINAVEGAIVLFSRGNKYLVEIDKRYNPEKVAKNIEFALLTKGK